MPSARTVDVQLRYASNTTGARFGVAVADPTATGTWANLPSTGGWQEWNDSGAVTAYQDAAKPVRARSATCSPE